MKDLIKLVAFLNVHLPMWAYGYKIVNIDTGKNNAFSYFKNKQWSKSRLKKCFYVSSKQGYYSHCMVRRWKLL